jgi:hypothetical protein
MRASGFGARPQLQLHRFRRDWDENPQAKYNCLPQTSGSPVVEAFELNSTGSDCWGSPWTLSEGQDTFAVSDANQDGYWLWHVNGNPVFNNAHSEGLFVSGIIDNNGERLNLDDGAKANFNRLERMNGNANYVDWNNTSHDSSLSDDPGYHGCWYSDTHTASLANGVSC